MMRATRRRRLTGFRTRGGLGGDSATQWRAGWREPHRFPRPPRLREVPLPRHLDQVGVQDPAGSLQLANALCRYVELPE